MKDVASNNTYVVIKNCPIFTGKANEDFPEYKNKARAWLLLDSKAIFGVLQIKAQPSVTLGTNDTAMLNVVAE